MIWRGFAASKNLMNAPSFYCFGHHNKYNETIGKFCFSQWFESAFTVNKVTYKTAEHWMMAHKALLFNDVATYNQVIASPSPGAAMTINVDQR